MNFLGIVVYVGMFCYVASESSPIVSLKQGKIIGFKEFSLKGSQFYSFLNIPYAMPPIGDLRFKDPVPAPAWDGLLNATSMPAQCLQFDFLQMQMDNIEEEIQPSGSEDCVYLNVFTPKPSDSSANLPVMVYIHGGAFRHGGATMVPPYALLNEQIVLVAAQYRLGIFGFLSTEDSVIPGNMGLKDQQLALKWVQENIQEFGGDPQKVTLFGESAGAASVHMQMLSPGSKGLFQRAIMQSGTAFAPWAMTRQSRYYAEILGRDFGCPLREGSESFLQCIQTIGAKFLVLHDKEHLKWIFSPAYTVPRVDGDFLPDSPDVLIRDGNYNKVDLITGITRDEGAFVAAVMEANPEAHKNLAEDFDTYGPLSVFLPDTEEGLRKTQQIYRHYLKQHKIKVLPDVQKEIVDMFGSSYFGIGHQLSSLYHAKEEDLSLFLYEFSHLGKISLSAMLSNKTKGVAHADDLGYLFNGGEVFQQPLQSEEDKKMSEIFVKAWTNFAAYGNPTPPGSDYQWEKATLNDYKQLNLNPNPTMEPSYKKEEINFWLSLNLKEFENLHTNGVLRNFPNFVHEDIKSEL